MLHVAVLVVFCPADTSDCLSAALPDWLAHCSSLAASADALLKRAL